MTPAPRNDHAELSKEGATTDASRLAMELATLEGLPKQFDVLVASLLDGQRQAGTRAMMSQLGATRDNISSTMAALDSGMEKIEQNLRSQYADYLEAYVAFRTSALSLVELSDFVEALRSESVQRYLAKMREIQGEARPVFQRVAQTMLKRAMGIP